MFCDSFAFVLMFCGYFVLLDGMPVWWKYWAPYLSPLKYCLAAALFTQFNNRNFTPDANQTLPWEDGNELLAFYNVEISNYAEMWGYTGIVFLFALFFLIMTYVALRRIGLNR